MKNKKELKRFIGIVNDLGDYYIHDKSMKYHFEKWVMLPSCGRRFKMDEEQFEEFTNNTTARFIGYCTYGQGIGLDAL
jgi:hypothetical protein